MDAYGGQGKVCWRQDRFVQRFRRRARIRLQMDAMEAAEAAEASDAVTESGHRRAAEAGDAEAMSVLGAMLLRRGDLDGAEPHLRAATAAGDRAAANNLGVLLHQRGYADEAAGWWRIAAVAGSAAAAHALGPPPPRARRRAGRRVLAAPVRRVRATALGAYALADLLEHRGDAGAERWLRAAAERGHREAAYRLARLIEDGRDADTRGRRVRRVTPAGGGRAVVPAGRRARTPAGRAAPRRASWRSAASSRRRAAGT